MTAGLAANDVFEAAALGVASGIGVWVARRSRPDRLGHAAGYGVLLFVARLIWDAVGPTLAPASQGVIGPIIGIGVLGLILYLLWIEVRSLRQEAHPRQGE